jgi:hypothetical protein
VVLGDRGYLSGYHGPHGLHGFFRRLANAVSRRADDARNLLQRLTFIYLAIYLLVLHAIVLVGLLPSIYVAVQPARPATGSSSQGPAA